MASHFFYPVNLGSLGEPRRPRRLLLEELRSYRPAIGESNPDSSEPRILITDGNERRLVVMRALLEMRGYSVLEARNGPEAIEVALTRFPDLVLIDLELPLIDGLGVTRNLRHHSWLRDVPVVIMSEDEPAKHLSAVMDAGCDDYLSKPTDSDRLDSILDYYVPLRDSVAALRDEPAWA